MNKRATVKKARKAKAILVKRDRGSPAIKVVGRATIMIKAGTIFAGTTFKKDTHVFVQELVAGTDYAVHVSVGKAYVKELTGAKLKPSILGGFHLAPGSNAPVSTGGDSVPAVNPCSIWDVNFRPTCFPKGMTLVDLPGGKRFWCDIYLLGKDHLKDGTSKLGVTIADGNDPPQNPKGGYFKKLDFETAVAVMQHHGKTLLGAEESFAAYYGGTEKTALGTDPKVTGLDAPRTSKCGVMQPFGAMWQWGTDGHPDVPRAALFGGSWINGESAGSRYASLGFWPDNSADYLGARGRSDHLQLA